MFEKLNNELFIEKARIVHGDTYDYSLIDYKNTYTKIKIICPEHGTFEQRAFSHYHNGDGCPFCKSSRGEMKIKKFLDKKK